MKWKHMRVVPRSAVNVCYLSPCYRLDIHWIWISSLYVKLVYLKNIILPVCTWLFWWWRKMVTAPVDDVVTILSWSKNCKKKNKKNILKHTRIEGIICHSWFKILLSWYNKVKYCAFKLVSATNPFYCFVLYNKDLYILSANQSLIKLHIRREKVALVHFKCWQVPISG